MSKNMQTCLKCGNEIYRGDKFCDRCGSPVPSNKHISGNVAFYIFMAILIVLWIIMGMPTDRFWWK